MQPLVRAPPDLTHASFAEEFLQPVPSGQDPAAHRLSSPAAPGGRPVRGTDRAQLPAARKILAGGAEAAGQSAGATGQWVPV
ncbi:hypothetical protein GCM10017667_71790 [Streptomyces filamentosus]|uniref:Uncharacterized protein n=1 Tax=Streptomyces filamentosus TaxID=67294 RepID=A0A919BZ17_STRFL|nr:hypothetical protein GCM10017667_71790 [Streptomyces filamentosus]